MSSMLLAAAAVAISPPPTISAQQALNNAQRLYSVLPPPRQPCPEPAGNEIVVCRHLEDPNRQRVPSDVDNGDPNDGIPRAPDGTIPPHPGVVVLRGCFIPPCPKPPALIIDVKAIPKAPAGSEADRMSKGEIPTP